MSFTLRLVRQVSPNEDKIPRRKWLETVPHQTGPAALRDEGQLQRRVTMVVIMKCLEIMIETAKGEVLMGRNSFDNRLHLRPISHKTSRKSRIL